MGCSSAVPCRTPLGNDNGPISPWAAAACAVQSLCAANLGWGARWGENNEPGHPKKFLAAQHSTCSRRPQDPLRWPTSYLGRFKTTTNYWGASLRALADLGRSKGYALVACNRVRPARARLLPTPRSGLRQSLV